MDRVVDDSDGATDNEPDAGHAPSEKSTEDDDRDTPLFHADVGLDHQRLYSVGGGGCVSRSPAPLCLGIHSRGRGRAQAVAKVAPGTTAAPSQGATPAAAVGAAGAVGGRVPVSFPPSRGCSSRLTRRPC